MGSEPMAKILCIEDEADVRTDIVEELGDAGYETVEAIDGESGIAAIVASTPDLVLCDISMPRMTGFELLETLRCDHPQFAELPFIFLTAFADRESRLVGRRLGVDDYLTKPVDFEMLLAAVDSRLARKECLATIRHEHLAGCYRMMFGNEPDWDSGKEEHSAKRVALVASDEGDIAYLRQLTAHYEVSLEIHRRGRDFIESLDRGDPEVLLVSYRIDDLSPEELIARTRLRGGFAFPVVLIYPSRFAHLMHTAVQGADDAIRIPCNADEFIEKINRPRAEWGDILRYL